MSKIKVKAVKDPDLAEMFNQMLGTGESINMPIAYPKYINIKKHIESITEVLDIFCKAFALLKQEPYTEARNQIQLFINTCKSAMSDLFSISFPDNDWNTHTLIELSDEKKEEFSKVYDNVKKSNIVNLLIMTCDNLIQHKSKINISIEQIPLQYKYFVNMAGEGFVPFPFADSFNLKDVLTELCQDEAQNMSNVKLVIITLNKILSMSYTLYRLVTEPDIDVDAFVEVMRNNIKEVKKHIPRCDKAFDKILDSVEMLKDNFGGYYRDFVESKQSTIIMENFILDVSKSTKTDLETSRQFKQIISFYRKNAQNFSKNEKVKKLFDKLNENVAHLDQYENLNRARKNDDTEAAPDDQTPAAAAASVIAEDTRDLDELLDNINESSSSSSSASSRQKKKTGKKQKK